MVIKLERDMVEQDFINEKKMAVREFEEHKDFLREQVCQAKSCKELFLQL